MKAKSRKYMLKLLVLILAAFTFLAANEALALDIEYRARDFDRGMNNKRESTLEFTLIAENVDQEEVAVTRIYNMTMHVEADARDRNSGNVRRLSCDVTFAKPEGFANIRIFPGDSVRNRFSIPYTNFKGQWRWEGEEKDTDFFFTNMKVSITKAKYETN